MKVRRILWVCAMAISLQLAGCKSEGKSDDSNRMPEMEQLRYDNTLKKLNTLCEEASMSDSEDDFYRIKEELNLLRYDFNAENMGEEAQKKCRELKERIERYKSNPEELFNAKNSLSQGSGRVGTLLSRRNLNVKGVKRFPYSLNAGDNVELKLDCQGTISVNFYDVNRQKRIKQWQVSSSMADHINISSQGIYMLELIVDKGTAVANVSMSYKGTDNTLRPHVREKIIECRANDFLATKMDSISVRPVFDSPKKVGLRGNLKSVFSGKSRVVIPVPVPKGCDALVYSLRISTNEKTISSDGKFSENLSLYSSKIKLFGFNVYEGSISSGVVDRLLFNTRPPRDEDAFCNMYVFNNSSQAKKFQDGSASSGNYKYDMEQSQMGTQSCCGQLHPNGRKVIYIGVENERMRYDNYIWMEVAALYRTAKYVRPVYMTR